MLHILDVCSQWLFYPAFIAFVLCIFSYPFLVWKLTREWTAIAVFFFSWVMGVYVFVFGCYTTVFYLGGFWLFILLCVFGVGPSLAAIVILYMHHNAFDATFLLCALIAVVIARGVANVIFESMPRNSLPARLRTP